VSGVAWVFEQGGWVSYALAVVSVLLWSAVILRALALRPSSGEPSNVPARGEPIIAHFARKAHQHKDAPGRLDHLAQRTLRQLGSLRGVIKTLVAVAPLLGLLGTVIGMVEMFGSMQGTLGGEGKATVAGGISTALITTQLGLVIAAPGLIASYFLARQQLRRERDLQGVLHSLQQAAS